MKASRTSRRLFANIFSGILLVVCVVHPGVSEQKHLSRMNRDIADAMLNTVAGDLRSNYYDPKLKGIDLDSIIKKAKEGIANAETMDQAYLQIAGVFDALNDSHTYFFPPSSTMYFDYGWHYRMVGDHCLVTGVKPGSDAEKKGIKAGDEVLLLDGFTPSRDSLERIEYVISAISPQRQLEVYVRDLAGKVHKVELETEMREMKNVTDFHATNSDDSFRARMQWDEEIRRAAIHYAEIGPALMVIKLPGFFQSKFDVEGLLDKARTHKALIMDLRGNPGGEVDCLQYWLGGMFDKDVKIADRVTRKKTIPEFAKADRGHVFDGKLIVLVDSKSASATELFARVVQLEKRGIVIGDRSAGATMESTYFDHTTGINPMYEFAASVAEAQLLMTDKTSLEHTGVTPDEIKIPEAADLAASRDVVLAYAAKTAGVSLSPESAGKLFPKEWRKDLPYYF